MSDVKGKNIMVTGATSGIGRALTIKLNQAGARVAFCGRSQEKLEQLLLELHDVESQYYRAFDIADEKEIIKFVEASTAKFGLCDILVNCAGLNSAKARVTDIETKDLEWMIKINLVAPFVFMKEVFKRVEGHKPALCVNVLSSVCLFSNEGIGSYTASKAGIDALTKIFRKEMREKNIRVLSVYPGGVDTPFRENNRPDYLTPETVADTIISLMHYEKNTSIEEVVLRPMVEKNF